jgi:ABC-2 type transport system permease protein
VIGLKMPMLTWTNEMSPIKQSGAVAVALFGGWGICFALGGLYLLFGYRIGATLYLLIWTVLFAAAALLLLRWLDVRGAKAFAEL